jgi:hypothetical protein
VRRVASVLALAVGLPTGSLAAPQGPSPVLELAWAWTLPHSSLVPGSVVDVGRNGIDEILVSNGRSWQILRVADGLEQVSTSLPFEGGVQAVAGVETVGGSLEIAVLNRGVVSVQDALTATELRKFPGGMYGLDRLAVVDLDASGSLSAIACGSYGMSILDYATGTVVAAIPAARCLNLDVGQLDLDAALEIAIDFYPDGTTVLDGATLEVQWSTGGNPEHNPVIANLDGEGPAELVTGTYSPDVLTARSLVTGDVLWSVGLTGFWYLEGADLRADSAEELLVAEYGPGSDQQIDILDGRTGEVLGVLPDSLADWTAVGQFDGDAGLEVAWSLDGQGGDGRIVVTDSSSGQVEAESPPFRGFFSHLAPARLRPNEPISLMAPAWALESYTLGNPFAWNARSGELLEISHVPDWLGDDFVRMLFALPVDADGDGVQEVILGLQGDSSNDAIACLESGGTEIRWLVHASGALAKAPATSLDIDGDSKPELIVVTSIQTPAGSRLRVLALEAESGALKWSSAALGPAGAGYAWFLDYAVGDVDGDGLPDVVLLGDSYFSEFITIISAVSGDTLLPSTSLRARRIELTQRDSDSAAEIVALGSYTSTFSLIVVDPATGAAESTILESGAGVDLLSIADWTRDGVADFAISTWRRLKIVDGASLEFVWTSPFLGDSLSSEHLLSGDPDADGFPDLAVALQSGVAMFSPLSLFVFSDGFESGNTGEWSLAVP